MLMSLGLICGHAFSAVVYLQSLSHKTKSHITLPPSQHQIIVNPVNGKRERIFVDLEACYPTPEEPGSELSFEEIWAGNRGWLDQSWEDDAVDAVQFQIDEELDPEVQDLNPPMPQKVLVHHETVMLDENGNMIKPKNKKKKVAEVNETQISGFHNLPRHVSRLLTSEIVKAKLDSPSGPKIRKKHSAEPTMTMHTKAATDEIYDLFNAPLKPAHGEEESADEDDYETDGDYTSGAESTGTTRQISTSEAGDDDAEDDETSDVKSVSGWSDFTARKHIPSMDGAAAVEEPADTAEVSDLIDASDPEASRPLSERTDSQGEVEQDVDEEAVTPINEAFTPPETDTTFVPIPPEDYEPRTRPFRDSAERANIRLPFMTPITERTETSLGLTERKEQYKTPSRKDHPSTPTDDEEETTEVLSSPLIEVSSEPRMMTAAPKIALPFLPKTKGAAVPQPKALAPKGPIIKDLQCNPVDESIRAEILAKMLPPLSAYAGFYDHRDENYERGAEIRKYAKAVAKAKTGSEKTGSVHMPVVIQFSDVATQYTVKKELGAGAFAPVYLVENAAAGGEDAGTDDDAVVAMGRGAFAVRQRSELEALKMEAPPSPWEFHMMRLAHTRLGAHHRAAASVSHALEMHLFRDEGFLLLPYHPHGTLLDVVNHFRAEPSGVMDELLAMFFTVELLRTVEALHAKGVMHGDLKADNCLLRIDSSSSDSLSSSTDGAQHLGSHWRADGTGGWAARGVTLIDFGRGIDARCFSPDAHFVADWKTTAQDCAEMREGRPWTWQIDYHGLAGIVHCLLFGRYIETVRCDAGGLGTAAGRRYRVRESLKRYWQTDMWAECFDVLLNPGAFVGHEDGGRMPVLKSLRSVREKMEAWLEANCERGVGLRGLMVKIEAFARGKK
jgi:checkpoint serine/threonine-protein kinase